MSVWAEAQQWLDDSFPSTSPLVWAAHNGHNYDRPILLRHIAEAAQPPPRVARWVDTLHFARRAIRPKRYGPGQYTLGRLYSDATGESLTGAHDAEVDTRALGRVWRWLVEEVDDAPLKFQSYLQRERARRRRRRRRRRRSRRATTRRERRRRNAVRRSEKLPSRGRRCASTSSAWAPLEGDAARGRAGSA